MSEIKGMESLRELYRIGRGPSSSHTMGPEKICELFRADNRDADSFGVILYGSLAKTGKGHGTDRVIQKTLSPFDVQITFDADTTGLPHPNTMDIFAYKDGVQTAHARAYSVGGGRIRFEGSNVAEAEAVYPHTSFSAIVRYCKSNCMTLAQYVERFEGSQIWEYLAEIWCAMKESLHAGLQAEGILPGGLGVQRKAKFLNTNHAENESETTRENRIICSYAFAVSEQNAAGERIVTAPTCGASGVLPAVMYYYQQKRGYTDAEVLRALAVGGLVGNLVKTNASISGAECGCQAEVGTACAMTAAALGELKHFDKGQIEYAAEISIEHHLGLTCDPICGLVQIPCIERNAVAAMRAINATSLARFLSETRRISLDNVIHIMKQTGLDLSKEYKETGDGGLAKIDLNN